MLKVASKNSKKKVFVAMSGGVDSSVSAGLLEKVGYDVTGVFIKVWSPDWLPCDWREERRDAMRCAAVLQIPFLTFDLSKEYKRGVVDYMVREYKSGRVPNPDVMCNRNVKFGAFFKKAMSMGAEYVATGHYARVKKTGAKYELLEGVDKNKDQSYFLWTIGQKELSKTFFPVGGMEKGETRRIAEKLMLPTSQKKDSQGLCFLGKVDVKEFLKEFIKTKKGKVLDESGEVIGEHEGVELYSIGERHGFLITKKSPKETPYYIVAKNLKKNTLTVSQNKLSGVSAKKEIKIGGVNWMSGVEPNFNKKYSARVRYRQEKQGCRLKKIAGGILVVFDEAQEAVASGQSLVIYYGERCLGGGIIS